jgi:hypothetical protein
MTGNRIVRTKTIEGLATPGFIHNENYFFVNLEVYADGLVNCWELLDLALFEKRLRSGWVTMGIPDGKAIHVHGLGAWTVVDGHWPMSQEASLQRVEGLVRELNPRMENLHDCHGRTTEKIGNRKRSILGSPMHTPIRVSEAGVFGKKIKGEHLSVFVRTDAAVYLADLRAFADGVIELGRLPKPETLDSTQLRQAVEQGRVISSIPAGTRVEIHELGSFTAAAEQWSVDVQDVLRSVPDLVDAANDRPNSIQRCRAALEAYRAEPTAALRAALRVAYEAIPAHKRMYVGDMDTKDIEVRMILYGDQEIEHWSHRLVARARGEALPTITVPQPKKE